MTYFESQIKPAYKALKKAEKSDDVDLIVGSIDWLIITLKTYRSLGFEKIPDNLEDSE